MKEKFTEEEMEVLHGGTEMPFTGKYWNHHEAGGYNCKNCGTELFASDTRLDSSKGWRGLQGWPAFADAVEGAIKLTFDDSYGLHRTEARCAKCDVHLGHVFDDEHSPTNTHFCINSCALDFEKEE